MKTARELFEELGYEYNRYNNSIKYFDNSGTSFWYCSITFDLTNKEYSVRENDDYTSVDVKLHKAITKQMEELGWLE